MKSSLQIVFVAVCLTVAASHADATCISGLGSSQAGGAPKRMLRQNPAAAATSAPSAVTDASIVGLWLTTFYLGDGPTVWDQAYEVWHSDGTEEALDNAVPPSFGNVCVGAWKQDGKTVRLRHFAWNWNADGTLAGTFVLWVTATVDRGGQTFSGTFVTDSYDLDGNVIPQLHAEGIVRSARLTVD